MELGMQEVYGAMMPESELELFCEARGLVLMVRESCQLLIDWDSAEDWPSAGEMSKRLFVFKQIFPVTQFRRCRSKSGNWHIAIDMVYPLTEGEAIGLEHFLGSDPFRFLLGMRSVKEGHGVPSTLFVPVGNQFEAFEPIMKES